MSLRLITLHHHPQLGGFDERPLLEALVGQELLRVESHFYSFAGRPHLALLLRLEEERASDSRLPATPSIAVTASRPERASAPESRPARSFLEQLDGIARERAEALRRWRAEKARREGIPPFVILSNRNLVAMAEGNPGSKGALTKMPGFGEKSCERHGEEILQILAEIASRAADALVETQHD